MADLAGKQALIEIVDKHTGGWGHVNVDQIVLTDKKLAGWQDHPTRDILVDKRYLHLPIKNGATKRRMQIMVDGKPERFFDIELADSNPDWWAFCDLQAVQGKQSDALGRSAARRFARPGTSRVVERRARRRRDVPGIAPPPVPFLRAARLAQRPQRPGLSQRHVPFVLPAQSLRLELGQHALGTRRQPGPGPLARTAEALYPDELGTMFSGSAVVDTRNTAGFQTGGQPPIVLIYTAAGSPQFTQCLAYSNDAGRTWTKYAGNPVLAQLAAGNRDPKVFWHEPTGNWVMALYLEKDQFAIFTSTDLKEWDKTDDVRIPGTSECPELFPLPVEGEPGQTRWIFYGANGGYLVGQFDGRKFTRESGPHTLHQGNCFYASQTTTGCRRPTAAACSFPGDKWHFRACLSTR